MHITIDNRDKVTMDVPKILVELICNDISFVLDELQYRDMLSLFKFFHSYSKSIKVHPICFFCLPEADTGSISDLDRNPTSMRGLASGGTLPSRVSPRTPLKPARRRAGFI